MNKPKVGIIDYGMANMFSILRACEHVDLSPILTSDKNSLNRYDALILPGVGAFGEAMENLKKLDLIGAIKDFISSDKPFMGICLGMQLLFSESEEFGNYKGLDIIKGSVKRFAPDPGNRLFKVPHVGWNKILFNRGSNNLPIFTDLNDGEYMYFVHSYYVSPNNEQNIASLTDYSGVKYCSSLIKENVISFQFHPEKSATKGLQIYKNLRKIILNRREQENA